MSTLPNYSKFRVTVTIYFIKDVISCTFKLAVFVISVRVSQFMGIIHYIDTLYFQVIQLFKSLFHH